VVVHNCVPLWSPPEPRPTLIRGAIGIARAEPVILHHGPLDVDRGLETLCEAMLAPALSRAHLVLLGFGQHRDRLLSLAAETLFGGRIHLLDPVPPADLLPWVASADVGVMSNQPRSLNERLSTPNKLFESIAAGLPVVSPDFPERRRIILTDPLGPLGAVCDPTDPAVLAQTIASLIDVDAESRGDLRARCAAAARERWNWESESRSLLEAYQRMADTALRRASGESVV
jgi:glycosyltransferase involved in cell wall biosynthesis